MELYSHITNLVSNFQLQLNFDAVTIMTFVDILRLSQRKEGFKKWVGKFNITGIFLIWYPGICQVALDDNFDVYANGYTIIFTAMILRLHMKKFT